MSSAYFALRNVGANQMIGGGLNDHSSLKDHLVEQTTLQRGVCYRCILKNDAILKVTTQWQTLDRIRVKTADLYSIYYIECHLEE